MRAWLEEGVRLPKDRCGEQGGSSPPEREIVSLSELHFTLSSLRDYMSRIRKEQFVI